MSTQIPLFPQFLTKFPSTRYQGSKAKLAEWIWAQMADLKFETCLDAFGGTGAVGYRLKQAGKQVTYNDILSFNAQFGTALIENERVTLEHEEIEALLTPHPDEVVPDFIQRHFKDIYFTDEENAWIDRTITHIRHLNNPYKYALAFFALSQACIIKRPYNLFHRKNLYVRQAEVERSFGNKTTWDRPFEEWFRHFAQEANQAVFDNGKSNKAYNLNATDVPGHYDLVYIDPPYISKQGVAVDYRDFYHFLEGLMMYPEWGNYLDYHSKHRRLIREPNAWTNKSQIYAAFDRLFDRFRESIIVVSYRSDGIPAESALIHLMEKYKSTVRVAHFGQYKYALSKNSRSGEMLLIGT